MNTLVMIVQFVLGFSILVIVHELGHFLAAKAFGIRVEKFYLFFDVWGKRLIKFKYKDVEYGIGWLPLGGYVKIAGMIDESMDKAQMKRPRQPWEFRSKPAWQRLIVALSGVSFNVILSILVAWMLIVRFGETYIPNDSIKHGIVPGRLGKEIGLETGDKILAINNKKVIRFDEIFSPTVLLGKCKLRVLRGQQAFDIIVPANMLNKISKDQSVADFISPIPRATFLVGSIQKGSNAKKAGLLPGDVVIALNGHSIQFFDELQEQLVQNKNKEVALTVKRNALTATLNAWVAQDGTIGFVPNIEKPISQRDIFSFFAALPIGASQAWHTFTVNAQSLFKIITGQLQFQKAVAGPIKMAMIFGHQFDSKRFWYLVSLLSMSLAFMNLLPIPALDGGHALFFIVEMIKGGPLSEKFTETAQMIGVGLLLALMIFTMGNDILQLL